MYNQQLNSLKTFFETGSTRTYPFRKQQLIAVEESHPAA
jgi:hypothetical protein